MSKHLIAEKLTTQMRFVMVAVIALALIIFSAYEDLRHTTQTVGKDTAPSIIAASRLRAALADANSDAVNAYLTHQHSYVDDYRKKMNAVHDDLITAAQNITYKGERQAILTAEMNLALYENMIGGVHQANDYIAPIKTMGGVIIPACDAIDTTNFKHLDATYKDHTARHKYFKIGAIGMSLAVLFFMASIQMGLFRRTRRMFNHGMLVGTVLMVVMVIYSAVVLHSGETYLNVAKDDAFDSMHALWKAKATAYDANTDESLYMLFHGNAAAQAKSGEEFTKKADLLLPKNATGKKLGGYLGAEAANITFAGEREAAQRTLNAWVAYRKIDDQIRSYEQSGQYDKALALNLGVGQGQSNWAFTQFEKAITDTIAINQREFDTNISNAVAALKLFPYIFGGAIILTLLACYFGMRTRIEEYKF